MTKATKIGWIAVTILMILAFGIFIFSRLKLRSLQSEYVKGDELSQVQEDSMGLPVGKSNDSLPLGPTREGSLSIALNQGCLSKGEVLLTVKAVPIVCDGKCGVFIGAIPINWKKGSKTDLGGFVLSSADIQRSVGTALNNTLVSITVGQNGKTVQQALRLNGRYLFFEGEKAHMSLTVDAQSSRCESI